MKKIIQYFIVVICLFCIVSCNKKETEDHSLDGTYLINHVYSTKYKESMYPEEINASGSKIGIKGKKYDFVLNYKGGTIKVSGRYALGTDEESMTFYDGDNKLFGVGRFIKGNVYNEIYITIDGMETFMYCFEK